MKVAMLLLASGRGERLGAAVPKAYVRVAGEPLVLRSLRRLAAITDDRQIVLAVNPDDRAAHLEPWLAPMRAAGLDLVVDGGVTRQESMRRAFEASAPDAEIVLVHDAARPFFPVAAARVAIERAAAIGGAVLAVPVTDTLKRIDAAGRVVETVDRQVLRAAQTPQAARRTDLERALALAAADGFQATDDVALLEHAGIPVAIVDGSTDNLKITTPADLEIAERIVAGETHD